MLSSIAFAQLMVLSFGDRVLLCSVVDVCLGFRVPNPSLSPKHPLNPSAPCKHPIEFGVGAYCVGFRGSRLGLRHLGPPSLTCNAHG